MEVVILHELGKPCAQEKKKRKKEKQNGDITAQRIVGGEVKNVIAAFKYSNI